MNSSDQLLRHSLLVMAASQVGNVSSVLFHMVMGRLLTPAEYGILSSMLGLVMMAGMPLGALGSALTYYVARLVRDGRVGDVLPLVVRWAGRLLLAAGVLAALGVAFRGVPAAFFNLPGPGPWLLVLGVLAVVLVSPAVQGALQGLQAFGWGSAAGMAWGLVRLVAGSLLVWGVGATATWALAGHACGQVAGAAISMAGVVVILRGRRPTGQSLPRTRAYLWRTLVTLALFAFLMNADMLAVKHFFSPDDSGFYARAATIGRMVVFLPMPIAGALFPKIVSDGAMSRQDRRLLLKAMAYTGAVILPGLLVCSLAPWLPLGLLYHDWQPGAETVRLVRAALWAMAPIAPAFVLMNFQQAQNRFAMILVLGVVTAAYVGGVWAWHASLLQVLAVLAGVSLATFGLLGLTVGTAARAQTPDA